jgi:hypothetical protein
VVLSLLDVSLSESEVDEKSERCEWRKGRSDLGRRKERGRSSAIAFSRHEQRRERRDRIVCGCEGTKRRERNQNSRETETTRTKQRKMKTAERDYA